MKYCKLRIAWSAGWGFVAVLLCVLWVRSYWRLDMVVRTAPLSTLTFFSNIGTWGFSSGPSGLGYSAAPPKEPTWEFHSAQPNADMRSGFYYSSLPPFKSLQGSFWAASLLAIFFSAVTAMPWSTRFSLRTLLIATTLVAVVLGLCVWAVR